jgi:Abnormal spindle-like microcephaly-assoc'd, ASPM-SPD-2-Hydin
MTRLLPQFELERFACAVYRAAALLAFAAVTVSAFAQSTVHVIREQKHDVSASLFELDRMTPAQPHRFTPRILRILPTAPAASVPEYSEPDRALQQKALPPVAANLGLNIDGLGLGQYGFLLEYSPPDTNGAVGATQYVQWVNAEFAVFDKVTGALMAGPTQGNALWHGFGGGCEANNDGDPIVQYDKLANRWVLTQFSITTLPYLECVAVSTSSDATGTYNRYAFSFGDVDYADYPKLGVWPDAYYMSFNMFDGGGSFIGANACALDRNAMLRGDTTSIQCFQQPSNVASLLPSDMDGTIPPAAGEPAFFMNFAKNVIQLWSFHVDFVTPTNSTFTGPTVLPVATFAARCFRSCVSQPGTTQLLDALGDRPMYRLAYRQFANGIESLTFNHSISTGIRWYEVHSPNGTPTVFQQGTFSPDPSTRWMGSMAMDQSGDMALGYSVSSTSVYPSVYFTGRVATDTLGSMEGEQLIVSGGGSQTGGQNRWGDYSAMTVDPVDDCTLWYTQEYIQSTGSFNWNTRIANFIFPNCGSSASSPMAVVSPSKLVFAKTPIGQTASLTETLTNTGNATLNLSNVATTGDYAVQTNTCGTQVLAGANCAVTVAFTPTKKGARTGILQFTDNAANNPQKVNLTGTGISIALSPAALNFGSEPIGQPTAPQTVTISNVSTVAVNLTGFTVAGAIADYPISANTCGSSLAAGTNCSLNVTFDPTKKGVRNAKLNVANKGGGVATATLSGTGTLN